MVRHEYWKPIYFGFKRSKVKITRHKKQCLRGLLHSFECWLLLVIIIIIIIIIIVDLQGGAVAQWVEDLDLRSTGRGFKSYSGQKLRNN